MDGWLETIVLLAVAYTALWVSAAVLTGDIARWRGWDAVGRSVHAARSARSDRRRRAGGEVVPMRRPIEQVGADLRRLHESFHRPGLRYAKYEGCRLAYDRVLAEAADMAGVTHLMELLPPGGELDHERERVELLLQHHGLLSPPHAA